MSDLRAEVVACFTQEELARIDVLIPRFSTAGRTATRADALHALAQIGLDAMESNATAPQSTARVHTMG